VTITQRPEEHQRAHEQGSESGVSTGPTMAL
jgi:hypothetical protein